MQLYGVLAVLGSFVNLISFHAKKKTRTEWPQKKGSEILCQKIINNFFFCIKFLAFGMKKLEYIL